MTWELRLQLKKKVYIDNSIYENYPSYYRIIHLNTYGRLLRVISPILKPTFLSTRFIINNNNKEEEQLPGDALHDTTEEEDLRGTWNPKAWNVTSRGIKNLCSIAVYNDNSSGDGVINSGVNGRGDYGLME